VKISSEDYHHRHRRSIYLLLENPRKSNNLGPILRCASAFGITTVIAVGYAKCAVEGSHGASKHINIIAFPTASQAVQYLRQDLGCDTLLGLLGGLPNGYDDTNGYPVGLLIHPTRDDDNCITDFNHGGTDYPDPDHQSHLVQAYTADYLESKIRSRGGLVTKQQLVPRSFSVASSCASTSINATKGNVGLAINTKNHSGLSLGLAEHCTAFLHIPHVAIVEKTNATNTNSGTANQQTLPVINLLDAPSCLSITLHHIAKWLGYQEHEFKGQKFKVQQQDTRQRQPANDHTTGTMRSFLHEERKQVKNWHEQLSEEAINEGAVGSLFLDNDPENDGDY